MFNGRFREDGGLDFLPHTKRDLKKYIKENPGQPFKIVPDFPESINQRKFFESAICQLVAYYHEGLDHRKNGDVNTVRDWLKMEFNGEYVELNGKANKIAKSTKGQLNKGFLERVEGYIYENYAPPPEALNPEKYKHWRDTVYPYGGPDNYIDYLVEIGILK